MRKWKKAFITLFVLCVAVLVFFSIPKQQRMSIVFACNDKYVPHVGTAITSILMNADKDDKFDFYILQDDISEENKQKFEELKKIEDFNIKFIPVDKKRFKDFHSGRFTHYAYYRYIIPEIIRGKKALYLDADIVILKSLKEFWNTDISTVYAGVIEDDNHLTHLRFLGIQKYFYSGGILLNLEKMRKDNITEKLFQKTKEIQNEAFFKFPDQDPLNIVLKDNVLYLPLEWNFPYWKYCDINKILQLHFLGKDKPWDKPVRWNNYYWHYRQLSPWAKEKQPIAVIGQEKKYLWARKVPTIQ